MLLLARILAALLFLIFGFGKIIDLSCRVEYVVHLGPLPTVAAGVAIVMEIFVSIAIMAGVYTRELSALQR